MEEEEAKAKQMENCSNNGQMAMQNPTTTVSKDEVIAKLKDDGDFDNLRLRIIRKLKENEELRSNIISTVRQSEVLNQGGAASMKPRQLSDAIFDEVGSKVMNVLSDGVWEIIRSGDGMKNEIAQTVQSVYNKLVLPVRKEEGKSYSHDAIQIQNEVENKDTANSSGDTIDDNLSDAEPQEPPGFSLSNNHLNNKHKCKEELQRPMSCEEAMEEMNGVPNSNHPEDTMEAGDNDLGVPLGFSADVEHKQSFDSSDEDPEVPPGFG